MMVQDAAFKIRKATLDDLEGLVDLHCVSFRPEDHVPMMLGRDYVRAAYRWKVCGRESYVLLAEAGGKIVGLVAVCDRSFSVPMFKACLAEFLRSLAIKPSLFLEKSLWQRLLRRPDGSDRRGDFISGYPGVAQMIIGAVDSGFRGKGVFPALIEATKEASRSRGSRAIRAGVYKSNASSRKTFIKGEWTETPELETSDTVFYMAYLDPDLPKELEKGGR